MCYVILMENGTVEVTFSKHYVEASIKDCLEKGLDFQVIRFDPEKDWVKRIQM